MNVTHFDRTIADQKLKVEVGRLAQQADGSVVVTYGETTVLVTVVMGGETSSDYLPLFVDYQEKFYAAGKIKGSRFIKREGRPSEESVLTGRLIDRAIRPFFDDRLRNEVQVIVTVLSMDEKNDPDVPALFGASLALMISDIPWNGPVSALRVGYRDDKVVLNPSFEDREEGVLDAIITLNKEHRIVMMETSGKMVSEEIIREATEQLNPQIMEMISFQQEIQSQIGKDKRQVNISEHNKELFSAIQEVVRPHLDSLLYGDKSSTKLAKQKVLQKIAEVFPETNGLEHTVIKHELGRVFKENLIKDNRRPDDRGLTEIRSLSAEIDVVPRVHGSALFNRGDTQSLSLLTLGGPGEAQIIDEMEEEYKKHYLHHYNFPPYCVGEVRPLRGPGRREIGHGSLAEKALEPALPSLEVFPYTIRVVTEILGSNGSSSMASVCSSTLSLLAGGVPLKEPVAGIAMGIVEDVETGEYRLLTDIQGPEDFYGEMDFKVAGTRSGVTAIQMDIKGGGMSMEMFEKALAQAKDARYQILDTMSHVISEVRKDVSALAPKVEVVTINPQKIGEVIGSGGKTINKIIDETGVKIDIEDDGNIFITGVERANLDAAREMIESIIYEPQEGDVLMGTVVKIMPFGAFTRLTPNLDGLIHISEMSTQRIESVEDVLQLGEEVEVIVKKVDDAGKINLTLKHKIIPKS